MLSLRCGKVPSVVLSVAARVGVLVHVLVVAGCASDKPHYVQGPRMAAQQKVEIEDDGQPVQLPPARRVRPEEDDPSQPWSPNYGPGGASTAPAGLPPVQVPKQVDANYGAVARPVALLSNGGLLSMTDAAADALIASAINAHEMQRQ